MYQWNPFNDKLSSTPVLTAHSILFLHIVICGMTEFLIWIALTQKFDVTKAFWHDRWRLTVIHKQTMGSSNTSIQSYDKFPYKMSPRLQIKIQRKLWSAKQVHHLHKR